MRTLFLFFMFVVFMAGCKTTSEPPSISPEEATPEAQSMQPELVDGIVGVVTYMDLEGGFYGILGDDGGKYFPINLGVEFREDGLRVRFTMKERKDIMTTTMWGTTIEVTGMERM